MEIERLQNKQLGSVFKPLYVNQYSTVKQISDNGELKEDSELLLFEIGSKHLAFSKKKMAFHHIAQGYVNESPYMVTFCVICNSGMIMNPVVNNKMLHFRIAGAYNGMLLMVDEETNSYWDHITGDCLSGKHKGHQLEILASHQILTLQEILEEYSDCLYGKEKMNFIQKLFAKFANWKADINGQGFLPPGFKSSMLEVDDRLPEMEMGLGVWENKTAKFYPLKMIQQNGNYVFDEINSKSLLIYISPTTHTPNAFFLQKSSNPSFKDNKLVFSNGNYINSGNLFSKENKKIAVNKPNYIFLRWYGFASTFPNCAIKMNAD